MTDCKGGRPLTECPGVDNCADPGCLEAQEERDAQAQVEERVIAHLNTDPRYKPILDQLLDDDKGVVLSAADMVCDNTPLAPEEDPEYSKSLDKFCNFEGTPRDLGDLRIAEEPLNQMTVAKFKEALAAMDDGPNYREPKSISDTLDTIAQMRQQVHQEIPVVSVMDDPEDEEVIDAIMSELNHEPGDHEVRVALYEAYLAGSDARNGEIHTQQQAITLLKAELEEEQTRTRNRDVQLSAMAETNDRLSRELNTALEKLVANVAVNKTLLDKIEMVNTLLDEAERLDLDDDMKLTVADQQGYLRGYETAVRQLAQRRKSSDEHVTSLDKVREFHIAMNQPHGRPPLVWARLGASDQERMKSVWRLLFNLGNELKDFAGMADSETGRELFLRMQLMTEELAEVCECLTHQDMMGLMQELSDLQYVVDGTWLTLGLDAVKDHAFDEIHTANMSKLDHDGNPVLSDAGRVLKGPNYKKPSMMGTLWKARHLAGLEEDHRDGEDRRKEQLMVITPEKRGLSLGRRSGEEGLS